MLVLVLVRLRIGGACVIVPRVPCSQDSHEKAAVEKLGTYLMYCRCKPRGDSEVSETPVWSRNNAFV